LGDAAEINPHDALSIGMIVTELVINALKYAFPDDRPGHIVVRYSTDELGWRLSVEDDGIGAQGKSANGTGLGSNLVSTLAGQLRRTVVNETSRRGFRVIPTAIRLDPHVPIRACRLI
jgi:two-component sensor histidine kinase